MAINQGPYTTGGQLTAAEFTSIISETNPVITSSGQTINESDNNQMAISHAISGSKGDFYQEASGSAADVYVLEGSDSQQQIHQLRDGMRIRFRVTNANTGSSTINVNSLGAVTAKLNGSDLSGGELVAGEIVEFVYKQSSNEFDLIVDSAASATTTSQGISFIDQQITMSNNASDSDHDIDFTNGSFSFDDGTGQAYLSAITKQIDAVWAQGNNAGGLDTGVVSNDTWYYSFAIYNPTTKDSDILFSASPTSPTLPSDYTKKKRLKACFLKTDSSSNIEAFYMSGDMFFPTEQDYIVDQASQTASIGTLAGAFPSISVAATVTLYMSTTQSGFSSYSIWGNTGFIPTSATDAYRVSSIGTNNAFATAGTGLVSADDGVMSYRNWSSGGGVSNIRSGIIGIKDLS
jgi:hypothetical protein